MNGLLDKIVANGYWRINLRPLAMPAEKLAFVECEALIEKSRVELRGWDFPHISRRQDETHGHARAGEYVENWIDWEVHSEFWRMYRSSQFLHYRALWEDLDADRYNGRPRPAERVLSVGSAIYTVTEIFELMFRLYRNGAYLSGGILSFSLENSFHRHLWINDPDRMPFSEEKISGAEKISIERTLMPEDLASADHKISLSATCDFFAHFGWDVAPSTLANQQNRFLNRQF